jgi:hypothetical protein
MFAMGLTFASAPCASDDVGDRQRREFEVISVDGDDLTVRDEGTRRSGAGGFPLHGDGRPWPLAT